jgi:hypothetical protein
MATAKKAKAKGLASTVFTHTWKKGDKCAKMFYGIQGYREASIVEVTSIDLKTGTIFVDGETGITYDANGKEKENFFPGMRSEITPLPE